LATSRRKSSRGVAAVIAPAALFLVAAGGDYHPLAAGPDPTPVVDKGASCCVEIVAAERAPLSFVVSHVSASDMSLSPAPDQIVWASRLRVVDNPRLLPIGLAPEQGLQVKTILASRAISAAFPEIHSIGGVRPDALRWHPEGLALDVIIPNAGSPEGIALGNQIVSFALKNAKRFALQDAIWRGVYYTPTGAQAGGYGHYDHVHITTTGGGYPTGGEAYVG
jgi:hypothetical protein